MPVVIAPAEPADLPALAGLFGDYLAFYEVPRPPEAVRDFVAARLAGGETRFFVAHLTAAEGGAAGGPGLAGFVHLLPTWDTLGLGPAWILEDLFVAPAARRSGAGSALLAHAEAFARASGATRISLSTAHDNATAQRRYDAHGYVRDLRFRTYHRALRSH